MRDVPRQDVLRLDVVTSALFDRPLPGLEPEVDQGLAPLDTSAP